MAAKLGFFFHMWYIFKRVEKEHIFVKGVFDEEDQKKLDTCFVYASARLLDRACKCG